MDKVFLIRQNIYNLKNFNAFDPLILSKKKAWCKSGTRTPDAEPRDAPQRLKVELS